MIPEATQALIIVTDRDGVTEWINPAFARRTGFPIEDMRGVRPGTMLQGPETDPEAAAAIGRAVRELRSFDVEILNDTKDGRPYWNQLVGNPVRDQDGRTTHVIAVQTDVTARRAAELRAAEASRLAALGQLAGGIAHDMNNHLMVVSLNLDLLCESARSEPSVGLARAALAATMRGHDLTRQLLSFAQRTPQTRDLVAAKELLSTVVALLGRTMPEASSWSPTCAATARC